MNPSRPAHSPNLLTRSGPIKAMRALTAVRSTTSVGMIPVTRPTNVSPPRLNQPMNSSAAAARASSIVPPLWIASLPPRVGPPSGPTSLLSLPIVRSGRRIGQLLADEAGGVIECLPGLVRHAVGGIAPTDLVEVHALQLGQFLHVCEHGESPQVPGGRSEEHTSELQSRENLVCRLLLE